MAEGGPASPEALAAWFRAHFRPGAARGLAAVIELEATGPGGGRVCLQIEGGELKTSLGGDVSPDVRLVGPLADWGDALSGRANVEMLVMEERIRIEGDLGLAMKLRALFGRRA